MNWKQEAKSLFILILGVAVFRYVYYQWYAAYVPHALQPVNDAQMYWQWGIDIYRLGWLYPHDEAYYQAPLFPMFLAMVHGLGYHSVQSVLFVQLCLGVINTVLCYCIARQVLSNHDSLFAAVLFSLCPFVFFFETKLTATTLGLFLWLCFLLVTVFWVKNKTWYLLVSSALLFGLSIICRPNLLFTLPFICFFVLDGWNGFRKRSLQSLRYGACALFALIVIGMIACVTVKNYLSSGEWVLITGNSGVTLYMGNNPNATGGLARVEGLSNNIEDQVYGGVRLASQLAGKELTLNESSQFWIGKTVEYIQQNQVEWLALLGKKLLWSVNYHPPSVNYSFLFESEWILLEKFFLLISAAVLVMGILAFIVYCRRLDEIQVLFLMLFFGYLTLSVVYYASGRFLTTMIPVLSILSVWFFRQKLVQYQNNQLNLSLLILAVWGVAFFVMNPFLMKYQDQEIATGWYNYGVLLEETPQDDGINAKACYLKAFEHFPYHTSAMLNLGVIISKEGELHNANQWFERVLKIEPKNRKALQNMIINLQRLNMPDRIEELKLRYPMD